MTVPVQPETVPGDKRSALSLVLSQIKSVLPNWERQGVTSLTILARGLIEEVEHALINQPNTAQPEPNAELEETLGALEGKHGEGWINITMKERRLFARLLRENIAHRSQPNTAQPEPNAELEETLGALEGKHGEGWINITMKERRLFARLLRENIAHRSQPNTAQPEPAEVTDEAVLDALYVFWPDWDELKSGNNKRSAKSKMRQVLQRFAAFPHMRQEWRDIANDPPPKDGTVVDLWLEPRDAFEAGNACRWTDCRFHDGCWRGRGNGVQHNVDLEYHWRVTHWMPLPAPPKAGR